MKEDIIARYNVERSKENNTLEENYKQPGVWALWAKNPEGKRVCLEVAQTKNIYVEISSALKILSTKDDSRCINCKEKYPARRKDTGYSATFDIHACKLCSHVSSLRTKALKRNPRYIDKYKDMLLHYRKFEFVLIDKSSAMKNKTNRYNKEKKYAEINKALYWCG